MAGLPKRILNIESKTRRPISKGAEKWLYRPIECLDYGFVYLVDYSGNDAAVAQAARVSYGKGTKRIREDRGLIRYLRRNMHTTPFEMVEFKFHCKMPIFVARQWIRHRTANVNEYSGRYSQMLNEFYIPDESVLWTQSKSNKQGGEKELLPSQQCCTVLAMLKKDFELQYDHYEKFLEFDLRKELARISLSVSNYTQWYWKIDLHNLMHFLGLRLDPHAQYEIRVFGEAMARIIKDSVPICYEAFEDYQLHSMKLTRLEIEFIKNNMARITFPEKKIKKHAMESFKNKRETDEFIEKLKRLGIVR